VRAVRYICAFCIAALCALGTAVWADDYTAVASRTSNDYERTQSIDRRFAPETYAIGIGGDYSGSERDKESERVGFNEVMGAIAGPLADQDYVPTKDPNKTKLLIMVYWGTTTGTGDSVADNTFKPNPVPSEISAKIGGMTPIIMSQGPALASNLSFEENYADAGILFNRGVSDARNAAILGYDSGLAVPAGSEITALHITRDDLIQDIRHNRYFVVLMAYDFQQLWKQKKHKLVWETRFSVRQKDIDFMKVLPSMAKYASQYFGKDTFGLVRRPLPEGEVQVGDARTVGLLQDGGGSSPVASMIGGPTAAEAEAQKWTAATVPPELARRIDEYKRDRAALMQDLAAKLHIHGGDSDPRVAVDAFNTANSSRIAMLSHTAQGIRVDLAQIAATDTPQGGEQSVSSLVKQFNAEIRTMDVTEPILTHP
jgi:hypothetical protein